MKYDIVIVGAGISGATLAERFANKLNKKVLVLEKREHIGGNCYDHIDEAGILVSKYAAHIFHTSYEDVWQYVNKFSRWHPYFHKVLSKVDGKLVPIPVNITTVNTLFNLSLKNEEEMKSWLAGQVVKIDHPKNGEESALSRVGPILYEKMFKNYTTKQWDTDPKNLDKSILDRIPVRFDFNDQYFSDPHQAMPTDGYTKIFENMLNNPNITVMLNTDYFSVQKDIEDYDQLFFTGPIDQFFGYKLGKKLQYRSLRFEFETLDKEYFQSNSVINYPNDNDFTRIVEFKYLTGQKHAKTTIVREYPTWEGEPYYPVINPENLALFDEYAKEANKSETGKVHFVGRLANYKYFNMDQAFKNSLDLFYRLNPTVTVEYMQNE